MNNHQMDCLLIVLIIAAAAGGAAMGRSAAGKSSAKSTFWCLLLSAVCTAIAAVNYALNMGWFRAVMLCLLLPFWYVMMLFMASKSASACLDHKWSRVMFIACHVCFLLSGLLFPDGGDVGGMYMFFGLMEDYPGVLTDLSVVFFVASLALMIAQVKVANSLRKKRSIEAVE